MRYRGHDAKRDDYEPVVVRELEPRFWKVTRISIADWPDLHAGKPSHPKYPSIWIEVKTGKRKPTANQVAQIQWMRSCGMKVVVCNDINALLKLLGE